MKQPTERTERKRYVIESSWDDGHDYDAKLMAILRMYSIPATFYLPGSCTLDRQIIADMDAEFEVGSHTFTHPPDMKLIPNQYLEIIEGKRWLESIVGHDVKKFCYPRGRFNDETVTCLRRAGITQARTTKIGVVKTPEDAYRRDTTVHVYNRPEYEGVDWFDYGIAKLREVTKHGGYFHIWGHSWEIARENQWDKLKDFLSEMQRAFKL